MSDSQPSTPRKLEDTETQTVVLNKVEDRDEQGNPILQLRLHQSKNEQKVKWTTDTVDNELMGKKKSKCCCVYEKPKVFGESDSSSSSDDNGNDDDGCTPHCRGHKKKCYRRKAHSLSHEDKCGVDAGSNSQ